jgi:hypothetical protein
VSFYKTTRLCSPEDSDLHFSITISSTSPLQNSIFPSGFLTSHLCMFLFTPTRAAYDRHLHRHNLKSHTVGMFCDVFLRTASHDFHLFSGQYAADRGEGDRRILYHTEQSGQAPGGGVPVHCLQRRRRTRHSGHATRRPVWVLPTSEMC